MACVTLGVSKAVIKYPPRGFNQPLVGVGFFFFPSLSVEGGLHISNEGEILTLHVHRIPEFNSGQWGAGLGFSKRECLIFWVRRAQLKAPRPCLSPENLESSPQRKSLPTRLLQKLNIIKYMTEE